MSELDELEQYLKEHDYIYERIDEEGIKIPGIEIPFGSIHQLIVYGDKEKSERLLDAICHYGSYGFVYPANNGSDASIDDLRQLETTVRKGTPIPEEKSAAAKIFFAINKLGGNNPKTDDEMTIGQAIEFLDNFNLECERECPEFSITSDDCKDGCEFVKAVNTIKKCTFVNVTEEELENIKANICDDYCNKRKEWIGDPDEMIDEVCVNCPLTRL